MDNQKQTQNQPDRDFEFKYHKSRLDLAFKFVKEHNSKAAPLNRIDDTFLISLSRYLQKKRCLTTKQHIALENFIEKWNMEF